MPDGATTSATASEIWVPWILKGLGLGFKVLGVLGFGVLGVWSFRGLGF